MIDFRVNVGVKAVLVRGSLVPQGLWLFGHKVDAD
jgi:hypothetical protein